MCVVFFLGQQILFFFFFLLWSSNFQQKECDEKELLTLFQLMREKQKEVTVAQEQKGMNWVAQHLKHTAENIWGMNVEGWANAAITLLFAAPKVVSAVN